MVIQITRNNAVNEKTNSDIQLMCQKKKTCCQKYGF